MTARRLAGAQRPAPPAGSPRKPEPRPGRRRARFLLLPVLALLFGALGLLVAAPAHAAHVQTTSWDTTLTVDLNTSLPTVYWGCDDKGRALDDCSTALTDNDLVFNGTTYTITGLYLMGNRVLESYVDERGRTRYRRSDDTFTVWQIILDFDKATPTAPMILHLGTAQLSTSNPQRFQRLSSSRVERGRIVPDLSNARWNWFRSERDGESYWEDLGVSWTHGQQVSVRLTWPRESVEKPAVSLLALPNPVAEGSFVSVTVRLAWELEHDVTIPLVVTRDTSEAGDHGTLPSLGIPAGFVSATRGISPSLTGVFKVCYLSMGCKAYLPRVALHSGFL